MIVLFIFIYLLCIIPALKIESHNCFKYSQRKKYLTHAPIPSLLVAKPRYVLLER